MPWPTRPVSDVRAALPRPRRLSIVTGSCTTSSALCVPSVSSSFQKDSSMRYCTQIVIHFSQINIKMSQTLCPDLNVNLLPPHSLKEENIVNMTSRCSSLLAVTSVVSVIRPHSFRTCPDLVFVWFCVPQKYKRIFKQDQALAVREVRGLRWVVYMC